MQMLYLIRHGETEWSLAKRHTGKTDLSLTEEGKKQVEGLKSVVQEISFDLVLTSPLKRAQETCTLCGFGSKAVIEPLLSEWDYGSYEGLTSAEIKKNNPSWNIFDQGAAGGETPENVTKRVDLLLSQLPQGKIALFSHGHLLRSLASRWVESSLHMGLFLALSPASLSVLGYEHERRVITRWNDTAYLC